MTFAQPGLPDHLAILGNGVGEPGGRFAGGRKQGVLRGKFGGDLYVQVAKLEFRVAVFWQTQVLKGRAIELCV